MKCKAYNCNAKPELNVSGFGQPHPLYYCPVCKTAVWIKCSGITNYSGKLIKYVEVPQLTPLNGSSLEDWYKNHSYYWRKEDKE